MIKDGQVRKLRCLLNAGSTLTAASRRTGMDEKSARKYRDSPGLPSEQVRARTYRTRKDPFEQVWSEVQARLEAEPRLRAYSLFSWLQETFPGEFPDSQRRTFERRVRAWRATNGPKQEVMFPQQHHPGQFAASDFTNMNSLRITISGQPFDHLLYHFTLTFSNWESVSICFSESFEALSRGLQDALWKLGGVPQKHRSDSLSAAVNNLSEDREFRGRYRDLLSHYRMEPHRINVRKAHENGDIESSHGHLKTAIDQALLLRGSRDFESREDYGSFLSRLIERRNLGRAKSFAAEQRHLGELPPEKVPFQTTLRGIKVSSSSSTIQIKRNTYSVHSRLIGHKVDVMIDADFVSVQHGGVEVQQMPRLVGSGKHAINYRHVIDSLVRKPGAFANYKYREDMFPTSHFRMAFDALCAGHTESVATREYLKILQLAAKESQDAVQDALRVAIANDAPISVDAIRVAVEKHQQLPAATDISIEPPDLQEFDSLLQQPDMEVNYEHENETTTTTKKHEQANDDTQAAAVEDCQQVDDNRIGCANEANTQEVVNCVATEGTRHRTDGAVPRPEDANVPRTLRGSGGESDAPIADSHPIPERANESRMPSSTRESDRTADATVATPNDEDLGELRLEATAASGGSADGESSRRSVPRPPRKSPAIRQARFGEEPLSFCVGRAADLTRQIGIVHHVQLVGATVVGCQT